MQPTTTFEPSISDLTPDRVLAQRARQGDHEAFAAIVARHDHRLRALAYRYLHDKERVEDALQDAYLKAFRNIDRYRGDAEVGTWLYRITTNVCLDHLRRERPWSRRVCTAEDVDVAGSESGPAERATDRSLLARALDVLPPDVRAAVVLVDGYGFDYAGASELLGVAPGTVGSRLNRGRRRLRGSLLAPIGGGER